MGTVILRTNAIPVYGFLSVINERGSQGGTPPRGVILDCGAGGPVPPLVLFHQHGFEGWGIDNSDEHLDMARQFCEQQGIDLHLRAGDMRRIPFENEIFDYVYEHYSMCHLSKRDTALAIREMHRVLKPGGLCFLGVISTDTSPKSLLGEKRSPGEYWGDEGGDLASHSVFSDEEADALVSGWEVVSKEKRVRYLRGLAEQQSLEAWMVLYEEALETTSPEEWRERYTARTNAFQYVHLYYILGKTG